MSHSHAIVIVEADTPDIVERVRAILAPYDENNQTLYVPTVYVCCETEPHCPSCAPYGGHEATAPNGRWDFWIIGGRWRGALYDRQITDEYVNRHGSHLLYVHDLTTSVRAINDRDGPAWPKVHDLIEPDGTWHTRETWDGEHWTDTPNWNGEVAEVLSAYPDHLAVSVDYHS